MQAQSTRTEVSTTSAQSLAAVKTLISASLGCITFSEVRAPVVESLFVLTKRNILETYYLVIISVTVSPARAWLSRCPELTSGHFTTSEDSLLSQSSDANQSIDSSRSSSRSVNSFKIMVFVESGFLAMINAKFQTMTRGYTDEADKILNYVEYGIFDALQRRYLRSFIFAIYLDDKDPTNIIEAYTFNFHYHKVPGTETVIPIMSLGDDLDKMSLRDSTNDPVAQAARKGKPPTLKDVKKSVKSMLKTLISSTNQMEELPKRRYAAFKLFYTDETPAEYEPPHFQAGDADKDKWFFMTHDLDEIPEKWNVGQLDTGHHSVNLSVASIAAHLPSSTENDHATFTGITTARHAAAPTLTPVEEAAVRAEQAAKQSKDAEAAPITESEYIRIADGSFVLVGVRNVMGNIEPLSVDNEEAHFGGVSQTVPTRLNDLNAKHKTDHTDIEQTQTQAIPDITADPISRGHSPSTSTGHDDDLFDSRASLPPSDVMSPLTSAHESDDIDTQMLQDLVLENHAYTEDSEMLDMETQVVPEESVDPIQSFGDDPMEDQVDDMPTPTAASKLPKKNVVDHGLSCECGVYIEDESCFCEGGCGRWYHLCFHSIKDRRIPHQFVCFDCRVRADLSWELIKVDLYPKMLSKFKDLALFRRAIKVAEMHNPESAADFAKFLGCDNVLARQVFKRLETEDFIVEQSTELDDLGFAQNTRSGKGKAKSKGKGKQRKNVQKTKYIFNRSSLSTTEYSDYFNPDHRVESRLLGLPQTKANVKTHIKPPVTASSNASATMPPPPPPLPLVPPPQNQNDSQTQEESQTQQETQPMDLSPVPLHTKRPLSNDGQRPKKKIKISMAPAVDLAE
ncbi:HORMA domain-containing protein [Mycena rebaudengoi]|nr:HORMA domain-containing protein [Mycena rebaudengoi]